MKTAFTAHLRHTNPTAAHF